MEGEGQMHVDRDGWKGSTDTPRWATLRTTKTPEPPSFSKESMSGTIVALFGKLAYKYKMP